MGLLHCATDPDWSLHTDMYAKFRKTLAVLLLFGSTIDAGREMVWGKMEID